MTERQVRLIADFRPDVIMVTPSYMLAIVDELERQGVDPRSTSLKVGIFGAEPWSEEMRREIEKRLDMHAVDIYGLSEVIGPGVACECREGKEALHVFDDHFFPEIVDPLIANLPELMAIICPTVNSYKRTVPGAWAPVNANWGIDNRTTAVRAIPGNAKSTRIEMRLSGADINPYLAMAASLAAGLDGIQHKRELPPATVNAYAGTDAAPLPRNLAAATKLLRESSVARSWLGDEFVDHYAATRDWEVRQFEKAVTDWELARYFESI